MNTMNIVDMEPYVRSYATKVFTRHGIKQHQVAVFLCHEQDGILRTSGNHPVNLYVKWPDALPNLNTLLNDFCNAFFRFHLHRTLEIVPYSYARQQHNENRRKWKRDIFTDESDIILDLIPKFRLRVHRSETVTVEDSLTGEKLSMVHSYPVDKFNGNDVGMWMQLSRIVRTKYPEQDEQQVEQRAETNELDNYMQSRIDS